MYSFLDDDEKKSVTYSPKPAVTTTPTPAPAVTAPAPSVKDEVPAALQRKTADYTPQTPWTPKEQRVEAPVVEAPQTDDLELVAVIAAAIAAATGSSTDDFVVRSIKRR